jgi:phosphonate transport system substrate-binding protein
MSGSTSLRFGISRVHGKANLIEAARGFAALLAKHLDLSVRLHVASDYEALLAEVVDRGLEIAWLPPLLHAQAAPRSAVLAAVSLRGATLTYRSAIVIRSDNPVQRIRDLGRIRLAWTDRNSASGYLFPRLRLEAEGLVPERDFVSETFHGPGFATCAAVADGAADVCACHVSDEAGSDPKRAAADLKLHYTAAEWRLRILAVTDSIPPDGLVINTHVDPALRDRITHELLALHTSTDGPRALHGLLTADRLVAVGPDVQRAVARSRGLIGTR